MSNDNLTKAELETNQETLKHIEKVREYLNYVCDLLRDRGINHDKSKLERPEVQIFTEYTKKLADLTYGSEEYEQCLEEMKPALDHHYAKNRHHALHHPNGVDDMNLIDIIEMLCDWKAASLRHNDGNILKSIEINTKKYNLSKQLVNIFKNTIILFEHK